MRFIKRIIIIFLGVFLFYSCVSEKKIAGRYDLETLKTHEYIKLKSDNSFKLVIVGEYCTDTFYGVWSKTLFDLKYHITEHKYSSCGMKPEYEVKYFNSSSTDKFIYVLHQNKPYPTAKVTVNDKLIVKPDTSGMCVLKKEKEINRIKLSNCLGFYQGFEVDLKNNNSNVIFVNITSDFYKFTYNYIPEKGHWAYTKNSLKMKGKLKLHSYLYLKSSKKEEPLIVDIY